MRIIAGQFRSRLILGPEDDKTTRPITDRVKQSLFDTLTPLLGGAIVYDCFSGTGSLGLEALSRGAAHATFFEADRSALVRLTKNIESLGVEDATTVVAGDLFKFFEARPAPARRANFVFLDPPYRFLVEQPDRLRRLGAGLAEHLAEEGLIVFRHDAANQLPLEGFRSEQSKIYGGMMLEFLRAGA